MRFLYSTVPRGINWTWVLVILIGVLAACLLTYLTSLIWPPPHPFWV